MNFTDHRPVIGYFQLQIKQRDEYSVSDDGTQKQTFQQFLEDRFQRNIHIHDQFNEIDVANAPSLSGHQSYQVSQADQVSLKKPKNQIDLNVIPSNHSIGRLPLDTQFDEEEELDTVHDEFEDMPNDTFQSNQESAEVENSYAS